MKTHHLVALLASLAAFSLSAQAVTVKEDAPGLLKQAKVSSQAATATALARVPGGKVTAAEIEKEDGKLIYSFDISTAGKSGIDEVHVDALSGKVLRVVHETPADEAKEAKADKAKAAAPKPKKPGV